tara:strand:+ start:886 stop:1287 length:402 start_codon:yes stop_codon:yes gene_type:complete
MNSTEIINETVKYYTDNPNMRAVDYDGSCLYNTSDGRHCAIGRCLSKKYKDQGWELSGNAAGLDSLVEDNLGKSPGNSLDDMLMPRYRGQSFEFWDRLQKFHDRDRNWDENGLTENGKGHVIELRDFYYETIN